VTDGVALLLLLLHTALQLTQAMLGGSK